MSNQSVEQIMVSDCLHWKGIISSKKQDKSRIICGRSCDENFYNSTSVLDLKNEYKCQSFDFFLPF